MSLRKQLDCVAHEYDIFARAVENINSRLTSITDKLDEPKEVTQYMRIKFVRNWINHILLWCIFVLLLVLLLSSCFVSGRTIHISTPRVEMTADTATAYSWPYGTSYE